MFGELIGLWAAAVWDQQGRPDPLRFVELGPGRGTLMADALRAARVLPAFRAALEVHLVETSPRLTALQQETLKGVAPDQWHADIDRVPLGPAIIVANEFFDALPIRHYVHDGNAWRERLIGLDAAGALTFGLSGVAETDIAVAGVRGAVLEIGAAAQLMMGRLAARIADRGGALIAIDYGAAGLPRAVTLQAVRRHCAADPLDEPGTADLTAHVDFSALAAAARAAGATVHGPVPQGAFLERLGIRERAARLKRGADAVAQAAIDAALARLVGGDPGMGALFKVIAVTRRDAPSPPGFEADA
jgi:SAM-dependent MidA family methyltransferase